MEEVMNEFWVLVLVRGASVNGKELVLATGSDEHQETDHV